MIIFASQNNLPNIKAKTKEPTPAVVWMTIPPAKSKAPNLRKIRKKGFKIMVLFEPTVSPNPVSYRVVDYDFPENSKGKEGFPLDTFGVSSSHK